MPQVLLQKIAISVPAATGTTNYQFDNLDLSWSDILRFRLNCATFGTDAGDTFNAYIQSRLPDGTWADRVAFGQYLGTATDAEVQDAVVSKFATLESGEEVSEPQGSAGGARLTAGTVVNGPFPGKYYESGRLSYAWRLQIVVVDADSDGSLTGNLYVMGDEAL